jgi:hypothetical protein
MKGKLPASVAGDVNSGASVVVVLRGELMPCRLSRTAPDRLGAWGAFFP